MRHQLTLTLCLGLCAVLVAACPSAPGGAAKAPKKTAYPVEVEKVQSRVVDYTVNAVGSVEAFEVVQVTARVAGAVEKVLFKEGQEVAANEVLIEIELQRFQLEVEAARAVAKRAQTSYEDTKWGLDKRKDAQAKSPTVFSTEEIKTWETKTAVAKAAWDEEEVNVKRAELNKQYASPNTPVAGIIQTRNIQTGQYVQAGSVIATLMRREPLLVKFQVPERDAQALSVGQAATFRVNSVNADLGAKLILVAASAEGSSRLVSVTAQVNDADVLKVRPGSFAQVSIVVATRSDAPTVPETAVRPSAEGFLAFVVEEGVAKKRILLLGLRTADGRVEVREGIKTGETLVIRGAEALRDGAAVQVSGAAAGGSAP